MANALSRLVKLHPAHLSFPLALILPSLFSTLSSSLALARSLTLQHNLWSTPDPESYLYDICVHYLAQAVQGTGISSRDELRRFGKRRRKRRARVPSLSASEELIQPPETSSFYDLPRSGKNNFPGFSPLALGSPFPDGVMLKNSRRYLLR